MGNEDRIDVLLGDIKTVCGQALMRLLMLETFIYNGHDHSHIGKEQTQRIREEMMEILDYVREIEEDRVMPGDGG